VSGEVRFAAVGAGFWARYQLSAWRELPGVRCAAICDRDRARAEALARELDIPAVYGDAEEMLRRERPAFLEVITTEESHAALVQLAVQQRVPVICQKPMAPTWEAAQQMVRGARDAGVPLFVHENFRFQAPMRAARRVLDEGRIGVPYRGRIQFVTGFPVFANQPNLKQLERFVLTDMGSHQFDLARFFFGEPARLTCVTRRVNDDIRGEDAATALIETRAGATVMCVMGLAGTPVEDDAFPETLLFIEGTRGSLTVDAGCRLGVTTARGTERTRVRPPRYAWADPDYLVAHTSMVACHRDILDGILGRKSAETTGEDNLRTAEMVFAAYRSAATGQTIALGAEEGRR
jgi:predicted dehydrogenase